MKKTIKQRFFLSLCLLMLFSLFGGGNLAWAGDVTIEPDKTWTAASHKITKTVSGVTFDFSGGTADPAYYSDGLRTYEGCEITISSEQLISKIVFTYTIKNSGSLTLQTTGTWNSSTKTWTGSADAVSFKVGHSSGKSNGQVKITKIVVTTDDSPVLISSISELSFGEVETSSNKPQSFILSGRNLTENAALSITGTDAGYFSVAPASVSQTDGTIAEKEVTVTYAPTAVGAHTATLQIKSGETIKEIALSGTGIAPLPTYNVSWMVNGVSYTTGNPSTSVKEGESVTALPTEPAAIGTKKFVGWSNEQIAVAQLAAPDVLFTTPKDAPTVTDHVTYYAVFATGTVTSDAKSLSEITDGGVYHIVATESGTNYYLKANQTAGAGQRGSTTDVAEAGEFILEGSGDTWAIKVKGTEYYMALNGSNASVTYQNAAANYTVTDETNAMKFVIGDRQLCLNGGFLTRFGSYADTYDGAVYIWLKGIGSYTDYVTTISSSAFTVTFNAGANGTCETTSLTETAAGAGVTLPACAKEGYKFVGWSTSETPTSADAGQAGETYHPSVDCTLYAYYKQLYTVTIEEPANGTIEVKHGENVVNNGEKFVAGDVLTITATPAADYKFRNLQVKDATTHTYTASNVKEWTMDEADITISANFDEITYSTITKVVNGKSTEEQVENGTEIPFTNPDAASIPTGYVFMGWTETPVVGTQLDAPTLVSSPVTASTDATYYAVFAVAKETTVVFDPNTVENNPELTWEQNGITLKLSAGRLYTETPKTFTVYNGSTNNFTVTSTVGNLKQLTATISDTNYKINSSGLTSGATLITNDITQTITFTQDLTEVVCPATSKYQIRLTRLEVQAVASPTDYCTTIPDVELAVGATGYATLYYSNFDLVVPENTEAYTFGSVDGELMESKRYDEGTVIPAGEAVVVYTANDVPCTLNFKKGIATAACDASSQLAGTDEATAITPDADYYFYGLSLNSSNDLNSVGFYWMEKDGAAFTNGAHKAYLKIPKNEFTGMLAIKGFAFNGTTTGVESVESNNHAPQVIYDLAGRRVSKAEKGIYIINGKKVIK